MRVYLVIWAKNLLQIGSFFIWFLWVFEVGFSSCISMNDLGDATITGHFILRHSHRHHPILPFRLDSLSIQTDTSGVYRYHLRLLVWLGTLVWLGLLPADRLALEHQTATGVEGLPWSFIKHLWDSILPHPITAYTADNLTITGFILAIFLSVYLNFFNGNTGKQSTKTLISNPQHINPNADL